MSTLLLGITPHAPEIRLLQDRLRNRRDRNRVRMEDPSVKWEEILALRAENALIKELVENPLPIKSEQVSYLDEIPVDGAPTY